MRNLFFTYIFISNFEKILGLMMVNDNKINFGADNLAYLEELDEPGVARADARVLQKAADFGVDLDAMESLDEPISVPNSKTSSFAPVTVSVSDSANQNTPKSARLKNEWSAFSLSMPDAILKIFELSDRPFIIIRDDKIAYLNNTALAILEVSNENDILGHSFWDFVDKQDWEMLAQNIGAMLTNDKILQTRLKTVKERIYKINLQAMYIDDAEHFTFALVGDRKIKYNPGAGLYDAVTGLPNFYLFEDRVQIAVNNEKYKDMRQRKNMMAVLGVNIDNMEELKEANMADFVLKKLASKLVFRLKKSYTVARGLKYPFWLLINDFNNEHDLEVELEKIKAIFDEPVVGNYMDYNVMTSFGYSIYPNNAKTANKLIETAIDAIRTAVKYKNS